MNVQTAAKHRNFADWPQDQLRRKWQQLREVEMRAEAARKAAESVKKWGVNTKHVPKLKTDRPTEMQRQILDLLRLRADVGTGRIAQILGIEKHTVYDCCIRLYARGALSSPPPRGGHARLWTITQAGLDALEHNTLSPIRSVVT